MEAAALSSNHFQLPVPQGVWSQTTLRRLIKSCCKLGYVTQAVVLCQLLQPVDYEMAFAILKEHASDTMDSIFPYFWDMTIIEYLIRILSAPPTFPPNSAKPHPTSHTQISWHVQQVVRVKPWYQFS